MRTIPKVSIIIPVYKVENHIERCVRSLFNQTFLELEFIFINDCSPDDSIQILNKIVKDFPERESYVNILHQKNNQGVANARNKGLDIACGEYILQIDSDDWLEPTMVEEMYAKAKENDSDIVWTDFYVDLPELSTSIYKKQIVKGTPEICIIDMLSGTLHAGLWNKLLRRSICTAFNIRFPEGINMCEDLVYIILYLLHIDRVTYLQKAFYHYVQNANSITIFRTLDSFESEFKVVNILEQCLPSEVYSNYIMMYKARVKRSMFFSGLFKYDLYYNRYPESEPYIYIGLNFVYKTAIWLSLRRMFFLAQRVLLVGQKYSIVKWSIIHKSQDLTDI